MDKNCSSKINEKSKRGVASLYVVIFATILFGVITVSFSRIILSEARQSSNDDLSQSAYDSAMAGVEDAKVAVNEYYDCVSEKGVAACANKNVFSEDAAKEDCADDGFPLGVKLHNTYGEVKIQESNTSTSGSSIDQAYTCVVISDTTPDYRGTLTSDTRTRVVPIAVNGSGTNSDMIGSVSKIRFSWYSELNQGSNTNANFKYANYDSSTNGGEGAWVLSNSSNKTMPPTMQATLIKAAGSVSPQDFWNENNTDKVLYSSLLLLPTGDSGYVINPISKSTILGAGNVTKDYNKVNHQPIGVMCESGQEFVCNVDLEVSGLLNNGDNVFLVVNMPYGDAFTDFKVELIKTNSDSTEARVDFHGSQISVDSTGRTNQLYRRVEARLDAADMFFPYPEFELSSTDGGSANVEKNSWVTSNCWHTWYSEEGWNNDTCNNNGKLSTE